MSNAKTTAISSDSDELQYIYLILRRLGCLQRKGSREHTSQNPIDPSLFPRKFFFKLIEERLDDLNGFAAEICNDLFKQIGGKTKKIDLKQLDEVESSAKKHVDRAQDSLRYPEFDEYFHCCIHYLYDFLIDFRWHEVDIDVLSKKDLDYIVKNLTNVNLFFQFRRTLFSMILRDSGKSPPIPDNRLASDKQPHQTTRKLKSNLASPTGHNSAKRTSPTLRRRVRFKESPPIDSEEGEEVVVDPDAPARRADNDRHFQQVHSVFALDLLIYAINLFVQRLTDNLVDWSNQVQTELAEFVDIIFTTKEKMRAKQLQAIAKRLKVYNDVHLSVLDYLNEIKTTYLIKQTIGTLCAQSTKKVLSLYEKPRIEAFIQKISQEVESKILNRLIKQCLQIFFNLLVCEINIPPVELGSSTPTRSQEQLVKSQENMLNFIAGWLKVDDILFGFAKPRKPLNEGRAKLDKMMKQLIHRPKLVAKNSTLSLEGLYASSSRILAQMDHLGEFMREFTRSIVERLRDRQQTRYILESIMSGLIEFFKTVAKTLEQQLTESHQRDQTDKTKQQGVRAGTNDGANETISNIDLVAAKIRCLKFIHIMTSAEKVVRSEADQATLELKCLVEFSKKLSNFTQNFVRLQQESQEG